MDLGWIRSGDGLVFGPYLPASIAWKLLRRELPFHLDLYCVTATEQMALWARFPGKASDVERLKLRKRYLLHVQAAEKIYVSCIEQWMVVAGMILSESSWNRAGLADVMTKNVIEIPMGVREDVFPVGSSNPYPSGLHSRPVFLWGGSLWNWFDLEGLAATFAILKERGSDAALFFLAGGNRTERASENDPVEWMRRKAGEQGLLGTNIFFNESSVAPSGLAPWLEHCRAGILTNPSSLEAVSSWRTRYLDLLWARKPLVVSGRDPLGDRMVDAGCAMRVGSGSARDLADNIQALAEKQELARSLGNRAADLASSYSWRQSLSPFANALGDPGAFQVYGKRPGVIDALGYFAT